MRVDYMSSVRNVIESSSIFDFDYYLDTYPEAQNYSDDLLEYWIRDGVKLGHNPHPLFDTNWYIRTHEFKDVDDQNPLFHYLTTGWKEFKDPCPSFSVEEYLARNKDVLDAGIEPLTHYINYGFEEGRPYFKSKNCDFHYPIKPYVANLSTVPEPGIKPVRLSLTKCGSVGAKNLQVLSFLRERVSVPEAALTEDFDKKELRFALSKLSLLRDSGEVLASLFDGSGPANAAMLDVLLSAGVNPPRKVDIENVPVTLVPIIERYNASRLDIARRLDFDTDLAGLEDGPIKFSILMPIYRPPLIFLERAILSVLLQTYSNWELVLIDDNSDSEEINNLLVYYEALDSRIRVIRQQKNGGISAATNAGLEVASGDYIGLLDHDDMITRDALSEIYRVLEKDSSVDWIYTDEAKIDEDNVPDEIYTKPDWSPSLLLNLMYTGHFTIYRTVLVEQLSGFRSNYDFSQDYDLALRFSELQVKVIHLAKCLYGWRMIPGSAASGGKPTARLSNLAALQDAANRRDYPSIAVGLPTGNRLMQVRHPESASVSIIIPSDNFQNILETLESVLTNSTYSNYELIVVTNTNLINANSRYVERYDIKFVPYDKPYNFSDKCNVGVDHCTGDFVLFLNDDVRVVSPNWIEVLLEAARLPNVGAVAPKLLYESGHIQHAGMVTGVHRLVGTAFHAYPDNTGAHFNLAQSLREVSLLCGACIMLPRSVFKEVGGFDAQNTPISHSDVDLCFKIREAGYSCIYTPFAKLTHIGHQSRESQVIDIAEKKAFKKDTSDIFLLRRWPEYCSYDPYFPPSLKGMVYIDSQEDFRLYPSPKVKNVDGPSALVVSHDLTQSGAPRVALDVTESLINAGYFVVVISPHDGAMRQEFLDAGAHVIVDSLAFRHHDNVRDLAINFDLVFANTCVSWPIVRQVGQFTDVFWYIHETGLVNELAHQFPDFVPTFEHAKAVWSGSERAQENLLSHGVKSIVLEYGAEDFRAASSGNAVKLGSNSQPVVISIFGSIEERKGQDIALSGFLLIPEDIRNNFVLNICGRTLDPSFAEALLRRGELHSNVRFLGEQNFSDYQKTLSRTDVVLCTSRDDTLPLVTLHALSQGKVLVVSADTGTSKYITDSVSGFILEQNTPEEVAQKLMAIWKKRDRMTRVSVQSRKVFDKNFTREVFDMKVTKILRSNETPLRT
ncbi:glycosyltransferase [Roseibium litorale]|uniref:Glycosyltransferase n=1 Tax=Roseibium litorale TaxID=2803841 RepID=A0ABR9CP05_9HYPH|nr:glycosyltransferase [Roseibium litorale]MBD8892473.1 glycosyltransferase [Roseibium litorale]